MRMVAWPRARCWRSRASPSGKARWERRSLHSSTASIRTRAAVSFVAAVEAAEEVTPVAAVDGEQPRRFRDQAGDHPRPLRQAEVPGRQPGIALDDVRGDERVLEVEDGSRGSGERIARLRALLAGSERPAFPGRF